MAKAPRSSRNPGAPKLDDEPGAEERFESGIANALRMPPRPQKPKDGPKDDLFALPPRDGGAGA